MSIHRLVALVSSAVLVGLLGVAQASNFAPPAKKAPKVTAESGLREKIQNAPKDGCG